MSANNSSITPPALVVAAVDHLDEMLERTQRVPLDELVEAAHLDGWKLGAHVAQMKSVDAGLVYRALQLLDGNRSPERLPSGPARIETLAEAITAFGDSAAERLETVRRLAGD